MLLQLRLLLKGHILLSLYCPHYDIEKARKPHLKELMEKVSEIGLAFDNCCAIEIIDETYRIITSKKQANAYKVYWKKEKYHQERIKQKKIFLPINELFKK